MLLKSKIGMIIMKCKACEGKGKFEINEKGKQYSNICYLCDGIGEIEICNSCNGLGEFISNHRFTPCMMCRGNGYSPKIVYDCKLCNGEKIIESITPSGFEDFDIIQEPCDCTNEHLMVDEQGNHTKYFLEIHKIRRNNNGL